MEFFSMQTVFENSLMQHHVALPPDAMGKITYVAPAGQYSLKVCLSNFVALPFFLRLVGGFSLGITSLTYRLQLTYLVADGPPLYLISYNISRKIGLTKWWNLLLFFSTPEMESIVVTCHLTVVSHFLFHFYNNIFW